MPLRFYKQEHYFNAFEDLKTGVPCIQSNALSYEGALDDINEATEVYAYTVVAHTDGQPTMHLEQEAEERLKNAGTENERLTGHELGINFERV